MHPDVYCGGVLYHTVLYVLFNRKFQKSIELEDKADKEGVVEMVRILITLKLLKPSLKEKECA
jgi:hypothetical protein